MRTVPELVSRYCDPGAVTALGGWDTNAVDLERAAEAKTPLGGFKGLFKCLARVGTLNLDRLEVPTCDTFIGTEIRPTSDSGVNGSLLGAKKDKSIAGLAGIAKELFDATATEPCIDLSPFAVGGRERRNKETLSNQELRSRLVLCADAVTCLIAGHYAQLITVAIMNSRGEARMGITQKELWYSRYLDYTHKNCWSWSYDISRSDQTVTEPLILGAFGICRAMFPESKEVDNHFTMIMSSFMMNRVITPGGYVYRIGPHTVPSGHPFTSIITTFAHWLAREDAHMRLGIPADAYYGEQSGDDARVHYKDARWMPEPERYRRVMGERWGLRIKTDPGSLTLGKVYASTMELCPEFLGVRHIGGIIGKDIFRLWDMTLMQRWPREHKAYQAARHHYMSGNNPMDAQAWEYHWSYFAEAFAQCPDEFKEGQMYEEGIIDRLKYKAMGEALADLSRWKTPDWLARRKAVWDRGKVPLYEYIPSTRAKLVRDTLRGRPVGKRRRLDMMAILGEIRPIRRPKDYNYIYDQIGRRVRDRNKFGEVGHEPDDVDYVEEDTIETRSDSEWDWREEAGWDSEGGEGDEQSESTTDDCCCHGTKVCTIFEEFRRRSALQLSEG
jgi:hypothetical protein